ncbi:MAG: tetratricopeptide repeat protein, partial [Desulfobaccales bacterium]
MKFSPKFLTPVSILVGVLLISVPALAASSADEALVRQAAKNLQQENYEEALAQLTKAWQTGPHTAEKAFYLGVVYRQLLDYPKARDYLEEAVRLKPNYMEARKLLADTLITLDKPDLALIQLKELEKAGYQPAQTAMMQGQVAMKQKRYREALEYFDKAKTDPALAQEASLQASLALAALNRLKEAQTTLKETIILAPQTSTAAFAQRYEAVVEKRLEEVQPFHFNVYAGVDYDSNVTLQPGGAAAASQVSGKG